MKTAKKKVSSVELYCPACEETILSPKRCSTYWDVNEIQAGAVVTCPACKTKCKLPKT